MTVRRSIAVLAALAAVLVGLNIWAQWTVVAWDLTARGSSSLSEETRRVLDELDRPIRITAFFGRDDVGRVEAATLLARYRRVNRLISWDILDPRTHPGEVDRLGVIQRGQAAVETLEGPEQVEIAQFAIEVDLTSAIARIVRETDAGVCFTTGHGERSPEDPSSEGLGRAAELLRSNGYRTRALDLLAEPRVPEGCDAVVVAAPRESLSSEAVEALVSYLRDAGKAVVLGDPRSGVDLSPLIEEWSLEFVDGRVVERDPASRLPDDPTSPIVRRYDPANPAVRGLAPTFFPGAQAVVADPEHGDPGLSVAAVAVTSDGAYLDVDRDGTFDPSEDREGPVGVVAAADDSEVRGARSESPEIHRTRILAVGDVDFATNRYLGEAANGRLVLQTVDWLTQAEPLVGAVPNFPEIRELELTEARSRYLLFLTAGAVPGLFLLAGGFVWVVRRGR